MPRAYRLPSLHHACYYYRREGARGRPIVRDREEFEILFDALRVALRKGGARLFAFHIDSSELHIVLRAGYAPVNMVLGLFCQEISRRVNRLRGESGPLFAQRSRVTLFEREVWLLPVARYVHSMRALSDSPSSWNSDDTYRGHRRLAGLSTTVVMRLLSSRIEGASVLDSAYTAYFDVPVPPKEIRLIEHGSREDRRILGDSTFITGVLCYQGRRAGTEAVGEEAADQAIRRAAELVIGRFHELCRQYLSELDARQWIIRTDLEQLRSKSRRMPLPFVRGMIADYALKRGLARCNEIEKFFGLQPKSLTAGLRRRYRSRMLTRLYRGSGIAPHRVPYIERSVQRVNAELLEDVVAIVFDG